MDKKILWIFALSILIGGFILCLNPLPLLAAPITAITPGDMAIVEFNLGENADPKTFKVIALADIPANEVIKITDRGWMSSDGFSTEHNDLEGVFTWTSDRLVPAGTVLHFSVTTQDRNFVETTDFGTISDITHWTDVGNLSLPFDPEYGEQIFIYQGEDASPTFIYGLNSGTAAESHGGWHAAADLPDSSVRPPGISENRTAPFTGIALTTMEAADGVGGEHDDHLAFDEDVLANGGTKEQWLEAISDPDSWNKHSSMPQTGPTTVTIILSNNLPTLPTALPYAEEPWLDHQIFLFIPLVMR